MTIVRNNQFIINGISLGILNEIGCKIRKTSFAVKNTFGVAGNLVISAHFKKTGKRHIQTLGIITGTLGDKMPTVTFEGDGPVDLILTWNTNSMTTEIFTHAVKCSNGYLDIDVSTIYDKEILRQGLRIKFNTLHEKCPAIKIYPVNGMFIRTELTVSNTTDVVSLEVAKFIGEVMPSKRGVPLTALNITNLSEAMASRANQFSATTVSIYNKIKTLSNSFKNTMPQTKKLAELYRELFSSVMCDYSKLHKTLEVN